jgi:hypothetical protein
MMAEKNDDQIVEIPTETRQAESRGSSRVSGRSERPARYRKRKSRESRWVTVAHWAVALTMMGILLSRWKMS